MIIINGVKWGVKLVSPFHTKLFQKNGSRSVGVCDNYTKTIYISWDLNRTMVYRVLKHELVHAILFSYDVKMDLDAEEHLAEWIEENREV
jgi:hypothetical protein